MSIKLVKYLVCDYCGGELGALPWASHPCAQCGKDYCRNHGGHVSLNGVYCGGEGGGSSDHLELCFQCLMFNNPGLVQKAT